MFITYSDILTNESFALEVGKRIKYHSWSTFYEKQNLTYNCNLYFNSYGFLTADIISKPIATVYLTRNYVINQAI